MNKYVMISLPMAGRTDKQIRDTWNKASERLRSQGYEVMNTLFDDPQEDNGDSFNTPLYYLGRSLIVMALCGTVYFCDGWDNARGCIIEHGAARVYGLKTMYESEPIEQN